MQPVISCFADYQGQYENAFFSVAAQEVFFEVEERLHRVATRIDDWMQNSDVIVKIVQIGTTLLAFDPTIDSFLDKPRQLNKDFKIVASLTKVFRTVDNLLHVNTAWKFVVLQISNTILFAISILSFIERFELFQTTSIKVMLAAIPILGVLPYGGLVFLSLGALSSTLLMLSIEKKDKLEQEEKRLIQEKNAFWSTSLDLSKVEQKQLHAEETSIKLRNEILLYETILMEGLQIEETFVLQGTETKKLSACRKVIKELSNLLRLKKTALRAHEKKARSWNLLIKQWATIDTQALDRFCQSKRQKWESKLEQLSFEKNINLLSMASSSILIFKQLVTLGGLFSKRIILPMNLNVTLELVSTTCGLTNFFMKKIFTKTVPSVDLSDYVNFSADLDIPTRFI